MPIKLSEIFNRIDQITRKDGLYNYFCNLFDNTEYVRSNDSSALTPFVDAVRNNPKSVVAMNDFAYMLERMTRADYDYFMSQPENKDIVELYNKADRGSEEYRNKLVDETIVRGKALIDGFEKETGISFERETQKYNQLKKAYSKIEHDWESYAEKYFVTNYDWQDPKKRSSELRAKIMEEAKRNFEVTKANFYINNIQPQKDKLQKDITRFREYLIDKSSITDEQANTWVKENIKFSEGFLFILSKNNQEKETYEKIIKDIYMITNGKPNLSTAIKINVEDIKENNWLAYANRRDSRIVVHEKEPLKQSTFAHELGHFVEYNETKSLSTVHQYLKRRSNNNIGNLSFYSKCYGYKDKFNDEYTGAMNWDGYTECISTGFEQLFFGEYGESCTEFDAEHMALLLGVIQTQTTKSPILSSRTKEKQNTVIAKAWKAAVKEAMTEKTYNEMLEREYTSRRPQWISLTPNEDNELWVNCKIKGLRNLHAIPFKSLEEIPLTMYLVWGYYFNKFPFREPEKKLLELLKQFRHSDSGGDTIVPFWYTIGMKLPAMV